ncbi:Hypothetical_protein [Hexamita inflata]|uniref:Hypothetical_protein n=1 Tax=Hexamita inflata TaxID=28002 RepID=A0ABP1GWY2_9EUKA
MNRTLYLSSRKNQIEIINSDAEIDLQLKLSSYPDVSEEQLNQIALIAFQTPTEDEARQFLILFYAYSKRNRTNTLVFKDQVEDLLVKLYFNFPNLLQQHLDCLNICVDQFHYLNAPYYQIIPSLVEQFQWQTDSIKCSIASFVLSVAECATDDEVISSTKEFYSNLLSDIENLNAPLQIEVITRFQTAGCYGMRPELEIQEYFVQWLTQKVKTFAENISDEKICLACVQTIAELTANQHFGRELVYLIDHIMKLAFKALSQKNINTELIVYCLRFLEIAVDANKSDQFQLCQKMIDCNLKNFLQLVGTLKGQKITVAVLRLHYLLVSIIPQDIIDLQYYLSTVLALDDLVQVWSINMIHKCFLFNPDLITSHMINDIARGRYSNNVLMQIAIFLTDAIPEIGNQYLILDPLIEQMRSYGPCYEFLTYFGFEDDTLYM